MSDIGPDTKQPEKAPEVPTEQPAEEVQLYPELTSSSSSQNEVASSGTTSSPPEEYKAYEKLLKKVALDLDIQVKEFRKPLNDILSIAGPC